MYLTTTSFCFPQLFNFPPNCSLHSEWLKLSNLMTDSLMHPRGRWMKIRCWRTMIYYRLLQEWDKWSHQLVCTWADIFSTTQIVLNWVCYLLNWGTKEMSIFGSNLHPIKQTNKNCLTKYSQNFTILSECQWVCWHILSKLKI